MYFSLDAGALHLCNASCVGDGIACEGKLGSEPCSLWLQGLLGRRREKH
jgi:hypothetical protein